MGDQVPTTDTQPLVVRYYTDSVITNRFLAWMGQSGLLLSGWRKSVFAATFFFGLLAVIVIGLIAWLGITSANSALAFLKLSLINAVIAAIVWRAFRWFPQLSRDRITIAPTFLQGMSAHEDRLLEIRRDDTVGANRITLRRYTAKCPICGSTVRVSVGRTQFPGRLVGRCGTAPTEHVFSFDPTTRNGAYLFWPHPYSKK